MRFDASGPGSAAAASAAFSTAFRISPPLTAYLLRGIGSPHRPAAVCVMDASGRARSVPVHRAGQLEARGCGSALQSRIEVRREIRREDDHSVVPLQFAQENADNRVGRPLEPYRPPLIVPRQSRPPRRKQHGALFPDEESHGRGIDEGRQQWRTSVCCTLTTEACSN